MSQNMNYIAIYVNDIESSRKFYEELGFVCISEKHEIGPAHYSIDVDGFTLEIYPRGKGNASSIRIGINRMKNISSLDNIVNDPDGNVIEFVN